MRGGLAGTRASSGFVCRWSGPWEDVIKGMNSDRDKKILHKSGDDLRKSVMGK